MNTRGVFTKTIIGGKLAFVVALLILSLINGYKEYVEKNPRKFMADSAITGVVGALAAVFLCYTRGRQDLWAQHALMVMMFFFMYHVCREFAGYFALTGNVNRTQGQDKQVKLLKLPLTIILGVAAVFLIGLALVSRDPPEFYGGILESFSDTVSFSIETFVTSLLFTLGEVYVLYNHGELTALRTVESFIMFAAGHVLLQYGGFYTTLYSPA
jgi:hypothetical protein